MKLEAEGQRAVVDPQSGEIQSTVALLSPPNRTFLILSRSGTSYIQARIVDSNRHALEYQDRSAEQHFQSARDDFSTGEVLGILEAYRRGEDSWRNENEWRRIDVSARKDPWDRLRLFLAIAALLLMFDAGIAVGRADGDPFFGLEAMAVIAMGFGALMVSAIIDLRRFRTMNALGKVRAIGAIGVGLLVVAVYWFERLTAR